MPQFPLVIPVIVLGVAVGSLLRGRSAKISKRKFATATLAAGLLNLAYAYAFLLLFPAPTITRGNFAVRPASDTIFLASSFLVAVILVVAVLGVAMIYARVRGGPESEEAQMAPSEEETKLISG